MPVRLHEQGPNSTTCHTNNHIQDPDASLNLSQMVNVQSESSLLFAPCRLERQKSKYRVQQKLIHHLFFTVTRTRSSGAFCQNIRLSSFAEVHLDLQSAKTCKG